MRPAGPFILLQQDGSQPSLGSLTVTNRSVGRISWIERLTSTKLLNWYN